MNLKEYWKGEAIMFCFFTLTFLIVLFYLFFYSSESTILPLIISIFFEACVIRSAVYSIYKYFKEPMSFGTIPSSFYDQYQNDLSPQHYPEEVDTKPKHQHEFIFYSFAKCYKVSHTGGEVEDEETREVNIVCKTCGRQDNFFTYLSEGIVKSFFKEKTVSDVDNIEGLLKVYSVEHPEMIKIQEKPVFGKVIEIPLKVKHNHMPRIFRLALYLAFTIMVWRAVLHIDQIILFIINLFHIHG